MDVTTITIIITISTTDPPPTVYAPIMVFLPTVLEGVPGWLILWPGGNGQLVKVTKVPAEATCRDDYHRLPRLLAVAAHCAVTTTIYHHNSLA